MDTLCFLAGAFLGSVLGFALHAILSVAHESDLCSACLHRTAVEVVPC